MSLPSGFEYETPPAPPRRKAPSVAAALLATGDAYDGDTFRLMTGTNARLYGADAFERDQMGVGPDGRPVPLGIQSRDLLRENLPGSTVTPTGSSSYNRPVATLLVEGGDFGRKSVAAGLSVPAPDYLRSDPSRLESYVDAQRDAIAYERGAYAGTYQRPDEYRKQGDAAPMRGKVPMTPEQMRTYRALLSDPTTTPEALEAWAASQGQPLTNAKQLIDFTRRNPRAAIPGYWQQADALDQAVMPAGQALPTRVLGAFNEGLPDVLGAPVDLVNAGLGAVGLPVSDRPFLGSEMIREGMHSLGIGQTDQSYAPRSQVEAYGQSVVRGLGQASLPAGGLLAAGGRIATSAVPAALRSTGAVRTAGRNLLMDAARNPGVTIAAEAGAGVGAGAGGQAARDAFPGNPWADMVGQTVGGIAGGGLAGVAAAGARPRAPVPEAASRAPGTPAAVENPFAPVGERVIAQAVEDVPPPAVAEAPVPAAPDAIEIAPEVAAAMREAETLPPVQPVRSARTISDARDAALDFVGTPIRNEATGIEATVSGNTLRKMTSNSAHARSSSFDDHALAVANVDDLFRGAKMVERGPDQKAGNTSVEAISRWHAPLETPNGLRMVRITVKETRHPDTPNPLYTVQTMEVEPARMAPSAAGIERVPGQNRNTPQAGSGTDIVATGILSNDPTFGPTRQTGERPSATDLAGLARSVDPADVRPVPSNSVASLDEAVAANPWTVRDLEAPDERAALPSYRLTPGGPKRKDPIDLVGWLRTQGGLRADRGELANMGISDNKPRPIEFAKGEGFLGRIVNPEGGMSLDEAAFRAWEDGWFPDLPERPTVREFLDAVADTHAGGPGRVFHPDDYATLDAYRSAQAQRGAVETAAQEGRPLAEEVGQPVNLDDLDANTPPATVYEDLSKVGGNVGNIRLEGLANADDIGRALQTVNDRFGGFDAARRGRIAQSETAALASEMGLTTDALLKRRQGQALNAEQALAARQLLARSGDELVKLAESAVGGSDEQLAAFHRGLLRHAAIQEQVAGMTAEAGRALAQFRMVADGNAIPKRALQDLVASAGGRRSVEDVAGSILDLQRVTGDPAKVNTFAAKAVKPTWRDKLIELWYNSLLSGPTTHAVNTLSNTVTSMLQVPEHAAASALGAGRSLVTGSADRVLASEVGARAFGLLKGAQEGLQAFHYTLKTGNVPDSVTKVESALQEAIPGRVGKVIRTPTRLLAAEDELFKAIARRMEINSLAVREASKSGLKGQAMRDRIAALSADPTPEMMESAMDYGRYLTFQRPLGPALSAVSNATNRSIPFKMILPFLRTPTNIFSFAMERSPLAPFVKGWRADMAAGGARRDLAVARASMGSGLGLMIANWAASGQITGSRPRDRDVAMMKEGDGWQPYSLKVGDRYYSYQRLDPVAMTLGFATDIANGMEKMNDPEAEKAGDEMLAMLMQQLKDKSFLSGISEVSMALDSRNGKLPERAGNYVARQASSLAIPALSAQLARAVDPIQRDTRDLTSPFLNRIPFASETLTPRTNPWGQPIVNEGGIGPDILSPMRTRTLKGHPVTEALLAVDSPLREPNRVIGGQQLSREDVNRYKLETGNRVAAALTPMVADPAWQAMPTPERKKIIDTLIRDSRREARAVLGIGKKAGGSSLPSGFEYEPKVALPAGFEYE